VYEVQKEGVNRLRCSVENDPVSERMVLTWRMAELSDDHPLIKRVTCPYTKALGSYIAVESSGLVGSMCILDQTSAADWFHSTSLLPLLPFVCATWHGKPPRSCDCCVRRALQTRPP
jgi:hypothetical protein